MCFFDFFDFFSFLGVGSSSDELQNNKQEILEPLLKSNTDIPASGHHQGTLDGRRGGKEIGSGLKNFD